MLDIAITASRAALQFYLRRDSSAGQHLSLHGIQPLTLADAQFDLHPVVCVVLEEETVVDDELGVGPRTVEYVDLRKGKTYRQTQRRLIFSGFSELH